MRLHQQLGHRGRRPQIAVHLHRAPAEREQIRQRGLREQRVELLERAVAIVEPSTQSHLPSVRPAAPAGAAAGQRHRCSPRQLGRSVGGDLATGIEAPERREVAVLRLEIVPVVDPFLQLSACSDLVGREPCARRAHLRNERRIGVEQRGRFVELRKQLADHLHVHRRTGGHRIGGERDAAHFIEERTVAWPRGIVLGGVGRRRDQPALRRMRHENVAQESRLIAQQRIDAAQVGAVDRETIVFEEVGHEPGAADRPRPPRGAVHRRGRAPQVGVLVHHPATRAPVFASGLLSGHGHLAHQLLERPDHLRQVAGLGRPIVHRQVDVDGVLGVPPRIWIVVPDPLQVGGLRARA